MNTTLIGLILGFVGLIILATDLYLRRKQHSQEKKFRREKIETEKNMFNDWAGNTDKLATLIKNKLIDSSFLYSNNIKIDSYSGTESIFNDRKRHYADEKKFIIDKFVPLLVDRCEYLLEKHNKNVCLLVDSGTTMHEFLERFAEETHMRANMLRENEKKNETLSISVATNNVSGALIAMEKGRLSSNRFSKMSFECHLFQGELLATYSAVTGDETDKAVIKYIEEKQKDTIFIGITVGNWIRVRTTGKPCAIPMARGKGHLSFKQTMINYSNEIFVISPLAKIFNDEKDKINTALKLDGTKPWKDPYGEINTKEKKIINENGKLIEIKLPEEEENILNRIKLVTTERTGNKNRFLLHDHAFNLKKRFENKYCSGNNIEKIKIDAIANIESLIIFEFNNLPRDKEIQKETEFPHKDTREPEFLKEFFNVM